MCETCEEKMIQEELNYNPRAASSGLSGVIGVMVEEENGLAVEYDADELRPAPGDYKILPAVQPKTTPNIPSSTSVAKEDAEKDSKKDWRIWALVVIALIIVILIVRMLIKK